MIQSLVWEFIKGILLITTDSWDKNVLPLIHKDNQHTWMAARQMTVTAMQIKFLLNSSSSLSRQPFVVQRKITYKVKSSLFSCQQNLNEFKANRIKKQKKNVTTDCKTYDLRITLCFQMHQGNHCKTEILSSHGKDSHEL